jgi:hypothetical protein
MSWLDAWGVYLKGRIVQELVIAAILLVPITYYWFKYED